MKKTVLLIVFVSMLMAVQAQDTVHFTQNRQDTTYYIPYGYSDFSTWGFTADSNLLVACHGPFILPFYYWGPDSGYISRECFPQYCDHPLTIYGVAVAKSKLWSDTLFGFDWEPYEHYCAWILQADISYVDDYWSSYSNNVTLHALDSARGVHSTRYFHVSLPTYSRDCDSIVLKPHDTTLLCYEFYFNEPVVVDSDFYLGVYLDSLLRIPPYYYNSYCFYVDQLKLCSSVRSGVLFHQHHHDGEINVFERSWVNYYPLIMAITVPPVDDTVPACGNVDSLWTAPGNPEQMFLSWDALSCATSYEVNYGSEKPLMDTTVVTSSTVLLLDGLMQGSLAYARVRPICHHVCPYHDTTDYGPWTDTLFFVVPTDTTPCPDVHGLAASWLDTDCVYVTWTPVDDQSTYQLNYAEADSLFENGTFVTCPHPYVPVCGLQTNKGYKMRVRTPCTTGMASEGYGPWSDTLLFNPQPTGIDDVEQGGLRLRPNPTRDRLTVERPAAGPATLEVFNTKGQKVLSTTTDQATVTLDVSGLTSGSYLLRVTTDEGSSVRTFVVGR